MAEQDAALSRWATPIFFIIVLTLFLYKLGVPIFVKLRNKIYAFIMDKISKPYNKGFLKNTKQKLFSELSSLEQPGKQLLILELGAGSGTNFEYFPPDCIVTCVDPNPEYQEYLRKNHDLFPHVAKVDFVVATAENISVESESVDAVVATLMMCSVKPLEKLLGEVKRVLKPGGKFLYLEHVGDEQWSFVAVLQHILYLPWWYICECNLIRQTGQYVRSAGFSNVEEKSFNLKTKLLFLKPHIAGVATK